MDNKEETYFGCCRSRTAEPKGESFEKQADNTFSHPHLQVVIEFTRRNHSVRLFGCLTIEEVLNVLSVTVPLR